MGRWVPDSEDAMNGTRMEIKILEEEAPQT